MILLLRLAGVLHFVVALANFFAARFFRYRANMALVEPFVREVFWVQNAFILLTTMALGTLCLRFPFELNGGSQLTRSLCGFGSVFWGLRLLVQLFFYDANTKRRFPLANRAFTLVFIFLTLTFGAAAIGF